MKSVSSLRFEPSADFGRKLALPPPMSTSGFAAKNCSTMRSYSARRRTCATIAAGVASSISVLVTMPTAIPMPALDQAADGLDPGIVERVGGAVGIDAHGVGRRLVAGGVGARRVGGIGDDRVAAGGRDQRHVRHVVDRELAARLAFGHAFREHACRDAMRERHAVADEQDDVLRLARAGIVDVP